MSALASATEMQPGSSVKWRRLEMAAFSEHPRVLEQLDPARKYGRKGVSGGFIVALPLMLLLAVVYGAPVWAFATLVGDRFGRSHPDPARTIPVAGTIFAVGLVLLIISFVRWLWRGYERPSAGAGHAAVNLVLGAICAVLVVVLGSRANVDNWQLWIIPIVISVLVSAVFVVLARARQRAHPVEKRNNARGSGNRSGSGSGHGSATGSGKGSVTSSRQGSARGSSQGSSQGSGNGSGQGLARGSSGGRGTAVEPLKRVREQVERLSPQDQAAVRRDITSAIEDLEQRGVITAPDAAWARGAELGKLALRMSQGRGPVATNPRGA